MARNFNDALATLRSLASRGDKMAMILIDLFDRLPGKVVTNETRPNPAKSPKGAMIWNASEADGRGAPNYSNTVNWLNSEGTITDG